MKKAKNIFYNTILIILAVLLVYVIYCSIFNIYQKKADLSPIILIIGTGIVILAAINIKKIASKIPEKKVDAIAIILCILFFTGLSIVGSKITSIPTYDLSNVQREANIMLQNGGKFATEGYFAKYTNQVPIAILVYFIYKIGEIIRFDNLKLFAIIVNSLFIAVTAFLTYLSVKKIKDYKSGFISLLFFVCNPILYIYSSYFYTDTLCMPFAAGSMYLFLLGIEKENKKRLLFFLTSGILLAIGFEIRVVVAILLIAMIMGILLKEKINKKNITNAVSLIVGFLLGIAIYATIANSFNVPKNKDFEFPLTHYLMYGSNYKTDGRFNSEDYNYTYSGKTYSEKVEKNIEKIKQRISEMGPIGIISFMSKKIAVNWSNGSYDYLSKFLNVEEINSLYEYISGNKKVFFTYMYQICKTAILTAFLLAVINEIKNKEKLKTKYNFIYIAVFGAFIFYLFWEVLTRYSLTFLPWMIVLFGIGTDEFKNLFNILTVKTKLNKQVTQKCISIAVMACSIILIIANYNKYTMEKHTYYDTRVMQSSAEQLDAIPRIANKKIEQTFSTKKPFNRISIRMKKKETKQITNYKFILKDNSGKELVKLEFTSNDVKNQKMRTFNFERIKPKEIQEYTIEISSKDATEDNSIGIETFCQDGIDSYPGGTLKVDGIEKNADFNFQVQNKVKRTYISKKIYILISAAIILIEIFAFYPYLKYNRDNI